MAAAFHIRPTEARDIPEITAIYGESVLTATASYELDPPGEEEMRRRWQETVGKGFPYLVATRGGAVIGYAYAGPYRPRLAYRFSTEDSIYVAPAAQGMGVGRALLTEVIRLCGAGGYRQMFAVIGGGAEHPASVGLHRALGFTEAGVLRSSGYKFGRWLDTMIMQRPLGDGDASLPAD
jgi:phosphinothricin acetyltransferase